jgi:hypothetical protein
VALFVSGRVEMYGDDFGEGGGYSRLATPLNAGVMWSTQSTAPRGPTS